MDGAMSSQAPNSLQNATSNSGWITWHSQSDNELRSQIIRHVYNIFSQRRPEYQGHAQKISEFSKRIEEMLYKTAKSREEYARLDTVEVRIKELLKNYMGARQASIAGQQQSSGMLPQPSLPTTQDGGLMPAANGGHATSPPMVPVLPNGPAPTADPNAAAPVAAIDRAAAVQQQQPPAATGGTPPPPSGNTPPPPAAGTQPQQPGAQPQQPGAAPAPPGAPVDPNAPKPNGSLAVAGAPAGNSTGDSGMRNSNSEMAANIITSAGGPAPPPTFMSNGAPVLLRGSGAAVTSGQGPVPQMMAMQPMPANMAGFPVAMAGLNGQAQFMNMGMGMGGQILVGGGGNGGAGQQQLPAFQAVFGNQQPTMMKLEGGGMVPVMSVNGGMVPMGGGLMPLVPSDQSTQTLAQQQQQQQQQLLAFTQSGYGMAMQNQQQQQAAAAAAAAQFIPIGGMDALARAPSEKEGSFAGILGAPPPINEGEAGPSDNGANAAKYEARKQQILKQQRWLLFLRHCAKCQVPESECQYGGNCTVAKQLWQHLINCKEPNCNYPRCTPSRELLKHHQKCSNAQCPVCAPVKQYVAKQRQVLIQRKLNSVNALPEDQRRQLVMQAQQKRLLQQQQEATSAVTQMAPQGGGATAVATAASLPGMDPNAPIIETAGPAKRPRQLLQENMGTSLAEYLDEQCITKHLELLKLEAKTTPQPRNRPTFSHDIPGMFQEEESSCKVCGLNRMTFEPPLLYCFLCGQRIKRNQTYYATSSKSEVKGHWCHPCFSQSAGDTLSLDTFSLRKTELEKRKNDDEVEESWVQCDRCEGWVHQICGLFNKGRNDESKGYLCPWCLLHGLQGGKRKVPNDRPQAWLSARDLPKCELSDFLELRLNQVLSAERAQRAASLGKLPHQVPTAEGLTVRVVNNVVKKCETRPRFLEAFGPQGYPDSFMYKQKVVLLFQQLEGVDMCLFCLYLQEYGDDTLPPNKRTVYLSYLDSVKYFQPENVEAASRHVRLRTLVYHELLSGYLEYAKQRGYTSMYIWACPPLAGDDYIMYCHPGRQKTPSSKLLREWYLVMLRQAKEEGTVVHLSNLFDTYFEDGRDHWNDKPSITTLPYLEGDYWPGEAENLLANLGEEPKVTGKGANKARKPSKGKRIVTDGSTDQTLMARLGTAIQGIREDFIVAHLYHNCSCCRQYISDSNRYYHPNPPQKVTARNERTFDGISLDKPGGDGARTVALVRFQLCQGCYDRESGQSSAGAPPQGLPSGIELTDLVAEHCPAIPATTDSVPEIENEFFDTRNAFLSLCQGNHFQFDSLRRARHSSMMVLYHLHNPSEPAFACSCNICNREIGPHDGGFRCNTCPDFDMCARCHANPAVTHPHSLQPHKNERFDETQMRLTDAQRTERAQQLQRTMQLLVHASACPGNCRSSNCAKVKALFQHAYTCKVKIGGGCAYCRRMWALLQAHAKMCTASDCPVPRCKDLRSFRRQQATRQEDKRRAAYREMLQNQDAGTTA